MPTTTIRRVELHHDTSGSGVDLVWGHGLTMSRAADDDSGLIDWTSVPATVTRYDARGHGASGADGDPTASSWASLALDQLELTAALGIDQYVAAGASMGCATALHAAVTAPERIRALILVIPPTAWESRAAQVEQYLIGASIVADHGVEPLIEIGRAQPPADPMVGDDEAADRRASMLRSWDPARLSAALAGAATADLPSREAIATISVPTMILAWTGDPGHPMATAEELHRLIVGSTLHVACSAADLAEWTNVISSFVATLQS